MKSRIILAYRNHLVNDFVKVALDQFKTADFTGAIEHVTKKISKRGATHYPRDNISTISLPQIIADFGTVSYPK